LAKYFDRYYPEIGQSCKENGFFYNDNNIPYYVRSLLNHEFSEDLEEEAKAFVREHGLEQIRNIGVLDMREEKST
jgi:hypothetical protein